MQSTANILSATQRRWFTALAALMVAAGATHTARAAEAQVQVQRVAIACTSSDCASSSQAPAGFARHAVAAEARSVRNTPTQSRRAASTRQENDGDRFRYDSCGCSGS